MIDADCARFESCSLARTDFAHSHIERAACIDCDLTEADFSNSKTAGVALHGSTLNGLKGALTLRGAAIETNQVLELGLRVLMELGVQIGDRD